MSPPWLTALNPSALAPSFTADLAGAYVLHRVVPLGCPVTLDGRGSSDDGRLQALSYSWASAARFSAAGPVATVSLLPLGTHVFTLTVNDGEFSARHDHHHRCDRADDCDRVAG
jgi:hypothetical protein